MDLIPPDKVPEGCRTACQAWVCVFHGDRLLQRCYLGTATDSVVLYPLSSGHPFEHTMSAFTNGVIIRGAAPE